MSSVWNKIPPPRDSGRRKRKHQRNERPGSKENSEKDFNWGKPSAIEYFRILRRSNKYYQGKMEWYKDNALREALNIKMKEFRGKI